MTDDTSEGAPPLAFTDFEPHDRLVMRLGVQYGLRYYVAGRKFGSVTLIAIGIDDRHIRPGRSQDYQAGIITQLAHYTA